MVYEWQEVYSAANLSQRPKENLGFGRELREGLDAVAVARLDREDGAWALVSAENVAMHHGEVLRRGLELVPVEPTVNGKCGLGIVRLRRRIGPLDATVYAPGEVEPRGECLESRVEEFDERHARA